MADVLLVERDSCRRLGVATALASAGLSISGKGSSLVEALNCRPPMLAEPEVVLVNLDTPEMQALRTWALLRSALPRARIVATTSGDDCCILQLALVAGVTVLMRPETDPSTLCELTKSAVDGEGNLEGYLLERIRRDLATSPEAMPRASPFPSAKFSDDPGAVRDALTPREETVLKLIAAGHDNCEISTALGITIGTVKNHVGNLLGKLGVHTRAAAVAWAWMHGLVGQHSLSESTSY